MSRNVEIDNWPFALSFGHVYSIKRKEYEILTRFVCRLVDEDMDPGTSIYILEKILIAVDFAYNKEGDVEDVDSMFKHRGIKPNSHELGLLLKYAGTIDLLSGYR